MKRLIIIVCASAVLGIASMASAQTAVLPNRDAMAAQPVRGLPFSGEGVVTLNLTMFDGNKISQTVPAKYYRDSEGRIRREQAIMGFFFFNANADTQPIVTLVDPVAGFIYTIVGDKKEAQRVPIDPHLPVVEMPAPETFRPKGFQVREEALGTKQIDGMTATGHRTTTTIPASLAGNEKAIEVYDERWEATELKVLLLSKHHDPRTGDVEYRLSNIKRAEPPRELFAVPAGYKIVDIRAPQGGPAVKVDANTRR